jgi:hypothetical protein
MGRHAADVMVKLNVRVPRGIQAYWDIIRELREFTIHDIDQRCAVEKDVIGDFVRRLARAGYIIEVAEGDDDAKVYTLIKDQAEAPHLKRDGSPAAEPGKGRDYMWRAMRMLNDFDAEDLASASCVDGFTVHLRTAKDYIYHLHKAGYLAMVSPAINGHKAGTGKLSRYKLRPDRRTGPLAPQIQRTKFVFDRNLQRVVTTNIESDGGDK